MRPVERTTHIILDHSSGKVMIQTSELSVYTKFKQRLDQNGAAYNIDLEQVPFQYRINCQTCDLKRR